MLILTNENKTFDLNNIGSELTENVYYNIFDYGDKSNYDYYCKMLCMLESFNSLAIQFQIGDKKIILPHDWSIVVADPETGDIELVPIHEINTRNFHAFVFNPMESMLHKFFPLKLTDVFTDVAWTVPRLGFHHFLLMPIENKDNPNCIFIINEKDQKKIAELEIGLFI